MKDGVVFVTKGLWCELVQVLKIISVLFLISILIKNLSIPILIIGLPVEDFLFAFSAFATTKVKFKKQTNLTLIVITHNQKRFMLSGRSIHAARTVYHCLSVLTNNDTLNNTTKNNYKPLITEMSNNSFFMLRSSFCIIQA